MCIRSSCQPKVMAARCFVENESKTFTKRMQRILEGVRNVGRKLAEMDFAF